MADNAAAKRALEGGASPPAKRAAPARGGGSNPDGLFARLLAGLTAADLVPSAAAAAAPVVDFATPVTRALLERLAAEGTDVALVGGAKASAEPAGFLVPHDAADLLAAFCGAEEQKGDFVEALYGGRTAGEEAARHPFVAVKAAAPAWEAVQALLAPGTHTVAVTGCGDDDGARVLTHHNVLSFVDERRAELEGVLAAELASLKVGGVLRNSVRETEPASSVFRGMSEQHLSAVAVVDERGSFLSNVADSDVEELVRAAGTCAKASKMLARPVLDLLSSLRQKETAATTPTPTFNVHGTDTLGKAVAKLVKARRNRVFLTSSAIFKPVSVISTTDVLAHLASQ